jgi:hypothetical protein
LSQAPAGAISTEHRYAIPIDAATAWTLISDVTNYRTWWKWLRQFEAQGLTAGEEWRCEVQPPLPYPVRFRVSIEEVEAPRWVRAIVKGDVVGTATLLIEDDPDVAPGCVAILTSSLAPGNTTLRLVSRLAAPVARFGHDWVLDSGARQFIARAVPPTLIDPTPPS